MPRSLAYRLSHVQALNLFGVAGDQQRAEALTTTTTWRLPPRTWFSALPLRLHRPLCTFLGHAVRAQIALMRSRVSSGAARESTALIQWPQPLLPISTPAVKQLALGFNSLIRPRSRRT